MDDSSNYVSKIYKNNGDNTFTNETAAWGRAKSFGIFDAISAGNLLFRGVLGSVSVFFDRSLCADRRDELS